MNAHEKVRAIEEEVSIELHKDWEELEKEKKEKAEINRNIEEFYQRMLSKVFLINLGQKKNVQVFVDPRSTKFRRNFRVIEEHIDRIRQLDPDKKICKTFNDW